MLSCIAPNAEQPIIQGLPADGIVQGAAGAGVLQEPAVQAAAAGAGAEVEAGVQGGLQAGVAAQAGVQAGAEVLLEPAVQEAPGVGAQAGVLLQPAVQEPDAAEDLQEDEGAEEVSAMQREHGAIKHITVLSLRAATNPFSLHYAS